MAKKACVRARCCSSVREAPERHMLAISGKAKVSFVRSCQDMRASHVRRRKRYAYLWVMRFHEEIRTSLGHAVSCESKRLVAWGPETRYGPSGERPGFASCWLTSVALGLPRQHAFSLAGSWSGETVLTPTPPRRQKPVMMAFMKAGCMAIM